jgi:acyl-CoA dehydrogenase
VTLAAKGLPSAAPSRPIPPFTDEHQQLREAIARFVAKELRPHADEWEDAEWFPNEVFSRMAELGYLGLKYPEEYGGEGGDYVHDAVLAEELAGSGSGGLSAGIGAHIGIATPPIWKFGTDDQKQRFLVPAIKGERIAALGITEPGAGSDVAGLRTFARKVDGGYVVNGSKTFITNGLLANLVMTVVRTDPEAGSKGYTLLMVETDGLQGFRRGSLLKKIGQKAQDTCELFFEDCRVPVAASLGEGEGLYQLMASLAYERTIVAVKSIAAIECAVRETLAHTKAREAFGKRLFDLQNTRFTLAEAQTTATIGRVFVDHCVQRVIDGTLDAETGAMAKWWLTEQQCRVVDDCLQLHGGYGYMLEYPIARLYADARVQPIYAGANEVMKELIARAL